MTDYKERIAGLYKKDQPIPSMSLNSRKLYRECPRKVWAELHMVKAPTLSLSDLRLRARKEMETNRLLEECKALGWVISKTHPKTGQPIRFQDGGLEVTVQAIGKDTAAPELGWFILETESVPDELFMKVIQHGFRAEFPSFYAHCQLSMGYSTIHRCMVMLSAENGDVYVERLSFNLADFEYYKDLAKDIYGNGAEMGSAPPRKDYGCSTCHYNDACYDMSFIPNIACGTCLYSRLRDGQVHCERWQSTIEKDVWPTGCAEHVFIPELLNFAKKGNSVENKEKVVISYTGINGQSFKMGGETSLQTENILTSKEMSLAGSTIIENATIMEIKREFVGSKIIEVTTDEQVKQG